MLTRAPAVVCACARSAVKSSVGSLVDGAVTGVPVGTGVGLASGSPVPSDTGVVIVLGCGPRTHYLLSPAGMGA